MSLINQMLKDLDARRGPASNAQLAALQGLGLANINQVNFHRGLFTASWLLGGIFVMLATYKGLSLWHQADVPEPFSKAGDTEMALIAPAAEQSFASESSNAAPEEQSTIPEVEPVVAASTSVEPVHTEPAPDPVPAPPPEARQEPVRQLSKEQKAERLFAQAEKASARNEEQRFERLLRAALELDPGHREARIQSAALMVRSNRLDEAEWILAQGLAREPQQLAFAMPYAQLLAERNALVPALEALERASVDTKLDSDGWALRAAILYRMDRPIDSAQAYRNALQEQPHQPMWWTGLAIALEQGGERGSALQAFRRASQLPLEESIREYVVQRIDALNAMQTPY